MHEQDTEGFLDAFDNVSRLTKKFGGGPMFEGRNYKLQHSWSTLC